MPLKMINAEEQVTEVITEVAEQIRFSDVKAKQREAILAFLSGKATFCFYSHFCFYFYVSNDESGSVVWLMLISSLRISSVRIFITCSVKLFTLSFQCSSGKRSKTNTAKLVSPFRKRAVAFNIS